MYQNGMFWSIRAKRTNEVEWEERKKKDVYTKWIKHINGNGEM